MVWPLICAFLSLDLEPVHSICVVRTRRDMHRGESHKYPMPVTQYKTSPTISGYLNVSCQPFPKTTESYPKSLLVIFAGINATGSQNVVDILLKHDIKTALNPAGRKHSTTKLKVSLRALCHSYFVYILNKTISRATYTLWCPFNATFNHHLNPAWHDNLSGQHEPYGWVNA